MRPHVIKSTSHGRTPPRDHRYQRPAYANCPIYLGRLVEYIQTDETQGGSKGRKLKP
jgi:hypothetical protein